MYWNLRLNNSHNHEAVGSVPQSGSAGPGVESGIRVSNFEIRLVSRSRNCQKFFGNLRLQPETLTIAFLTRTQNQQVFRSSGSSGESRRLVPAPLSCAALPHPATETRDADGYNNAAILTPNPSLHIRTPKMQSPTPH